jgi:hypothetical protein
MVCSSIKNDESLSHLADFVASVPAKLKNFICPISGELMRDPVEAEDGHNYERKQIIDWFAICQSTGQPTTSPIARVPMPQTLRSNHELKHAIDAAILECAAVTGLEGIDSIHKLNEIFKHLDPLQDILVETLENWRSPQVAVIGAESTGKSSVLQRLLMMAIFPTAEGICTRLPIHVRLRNRPEARAPSLEVFNVVTNTTVDGPHFVPMATAAVDVQEKMREVLLRENGALDGVSADHILILHVEGPSVPTLDVVDMPGLIAAPEPQRRETHALLERHVAQHGAYSMFLAVVPANTRPNTSIVMTFVQAHALESRTLGVFTMCDEYQMSLGKVSRKMHDPPDVDQGGIALAPHGWYATMNAPVEGGADIGAARLILQAEAETAFFKQHMPAEHAAGRTTSGALVAGLSDMFLEHVRSGWAPDTIRRLDEAQAETLRQSSRLGFPPLAGRSPEEVALARELAPKVARLGIRGGYSKAFQACCREVLAPLTHRITALLPNDVAQGGMKVEEAVDMWKAEADAVRDECKRTAAAWGAWWVEYIPRLMEWEEQGPGRGERESSFLVGRFPCYVSAAVGRGEAVVKGVVAGVVASAGDTIERYYADAKFVHFDLCSEPATVELRRSGAQLAQRVAQAFMNGGLALRDGLEDAAGKAAGEVEASGWVEACREERERLKEKITQVRLAKEGVLLALGLTEDTIKKAQSLTKVKSLLLKSVTEEAIMKEADKESGGNSKKATDATMAGALSLLLLLLLVPLLLVPLLLVPLILLLTLHGHKCTAFAGVSVGTAKKASKRLEKEVNEKVLKEAAATAAELS